MSVKRVKLLVCGDGGVGKSSITAAFLRRPFEDEHDPTIEDAYQTTLSLYQVGQVEVEVIDTAGQEEYKSLWSEAHVASSDAFIFVYSIDSSASFSSVDRFARTIRRVKRPDVDDEDPLSSINTTFPFILLGNKCDLGPGSRQVSSAEGLNYARSIGGLFSECSAKQNVNVQSSFEILLREVVKRQNDPPTPSSARNGAISIMTGDDNDNEKAPRPPRKKNPALALDRNRSISHGGLGRDPSHLSSQKKGCGCVVS